MKELNDTEEMELIDFIGNFKTREMERKDREETVPQKKKTIAFESTPTIPTMMKNKKMMKIFPSLWKM